jgi:uncharacterized protein (DUF2252 family)
VVITDRSCSIGVNGTSSRWRESGASRFGETTIIEEQPDKGAVIPTGTPERLGGLAAASLSPDERARLGKAARTQVPRRSHADWEPPSSRPDPISMLEEQAKTRIAELMPIRYGRMLVSPFAFFRGAARIMACDLASTPRSGFDVQLCGDAHLSNFGVFGTPERRLVFDLNDFDETNPGPWEWDLKRLATSIVVAGRERGFGRRDTRVSVTAALAEYRRATRRFAAMTNLEVWYAHLDVDELIERRRAEVDDGTVKRAEADVAKARTRDNLRAFARLTELVDGQPRIISDPPLIVPIEELVHGLEYDKVSEWLLSAFGDYAETLTTEHRRLFDQYRLVHVARKVVGVGSVGTRAWIALFLGRDTGDPLFLQIKEAVESVLEMFLGPSAYPEHGERVVTGQRLMQAASDMFLGWKRVLGPGGQRTTDFYVRQLHDWKGSANVERATPLSMASYSGICGWTLARAHARTGDRISIASYLGAGTVFDNSIAAFAEAYADQNERDFKALEAAVGSDRIQAAVGL